MSDTTLKFRSLVETLYDRTSRKLLKWRYDNNDQTVWVRLGGRNLVLSISSNDDFEPLVVVVIADIDGEVLERFTDETIGSEPPESASFKTYYEIMAAIYEAAKRQATGADEALDNVLTALNATNGAFDDEPF